MATKPEPNLLTFSHKAKLQAIWAYACLSHEFLLLQAGHDLRFVLGEATAAALVKKKVDGLLWDSCATVAMAKFPSPDKPAAGHGHKPL